MKNWKYLVIASLIGSSALAQFKFEKDAAGKEKLNGKIVLKDKAGADLEIKLDSKLVVELSPATSLDKMILKNQSQIKITSDKQEVVYDVEQTISSKVAGRVEYGGEKKANNQEFNIRCYTTVDPKNSADIKYVKGTIGCVKTTGCKGYVLGTNKKFNYTDTSLCTGSKEVKISTTAGVYEEKLTCVLFDDKAEKEQSWVNFSFTRPLPELTENHIEAGSTTTECK
jgi:hypothetical protein